MVRIGERAEHEAGGRRNVLSHLLSFWLCPYPLQPQPQAKRYTHTMAGGFRSRLALGSQILSFYQGPWPMAPGSQIHSFYQGPWQITARGFFGARESVEAGIGGDREGEVTIKGAEGGFSVALPACCLYCMRNGRKLQHWGSVSCFLTPKEREAAHFFFYKRPRRAPASLEVRRHRCGSEPRGGASWSAG